MERERKSLWIEFRRQLKKLEFRSDFVDDDEEDRSSNAKPLLSFLSCSSLYIARSRIASPVPWIMLDKTTTPN